MRTSILHNAFKLTAAIFLAVGFVVFAGVENCTAQSASNNDSLIPSRRGDDDQPRSVREHIAKQRAEKLKKDHDELLRRGEEVIALTEELEDAFANGNRLSAAELEKLESLEKLVSKIRKNLGGGDDGEDDKAEAADHTPNSVQDAFSKLKDAASNLVDELKRSSRFTVSVLAIQSSNSVLKIVRFLRFGK